MYCPECGKWNDEGSKYCGYCGAELIDNQPSNEHKGNKTFSFTAYYNEKIKPFFDQKVKPFAIEKVKLFYIQKVRSFTKQKLKPFVINHKIALSVSAAFLIVLCVGVGIVLSINDPKNIVEDYISAVKDEDWHQAYEYLDLKESEFIDSEKFASYAESELDYSMIDDYDIRKYDIDEYGNSMEGYIANNEEDLCYIIRYRYMGDFDLEYRYNLVILHKQDDNSFLFFPCYKISADDMITLCTIAALDSAKVAMDGIELSKSGATNDDGLVLYYVSPVFGGNHTVVTSMDQCDNSVNEIDLSYDNYLEVTSMDLSQDGIEYIDSIAQNFVKEWYEGAYNNKDFDDLDIQFTLDTDKREKLKEDYDALINIFHGEDETEIEDFEITSFSSSTEQDSIDTEQIFLSEMSFEIRYKLLYESDVTGEMESQNKQMTQETCILLNYENGEWVFMDQR